jgi:hypothetical protein
LWCGMFYPSFIGAPDNSSDYPMKKSLPVMNTHAMLKVKVMILFAVVLPLLFCATLAAQNRRMQFKGKVYDRETMVPVKGVNISISGTRRGASTNDAGEFAITIYEVPVYMTVSHVGYETQRIWLDNSSSSFTILLNPAPTLLQEVEIRSENKPLPFFRDNRYAVLDYEADSGLVYVLAYRFRLHNSELICKTLGGDTVARSGPLLFKPAGLFHDCIGNIHILSEDSAYQVWRRDDHLQVCHPVDIKRFRSVLPGCVASTESLLFLRKASPDGLVVQFDAVGRQTGYRKHLQSSADEIKLKMLHDSPRDQLLLMLDTIPDDFSTATYMHWLKRIIYKPNASSLHRIADLMCVFNTADQTLGLYTLGGDFTSKLKLQADRITDGRWTTDIYIDDMDNKAYTSFRKGGRYTIYRIDLNTGDLKLNVTAVHDFPEKITIHKGFLFYLYHMPGQNDNKQLLVQKL